MGKAFIRIIAPQDAEGPLKRAYKRIDGARGSIANVHQSQSLHPKAMMKHLDLYMALMYEESPLSRIQRELLGAVTSYFNNCEYCIIHHYEALKSHWSDAPTIKQLVIGKGISALDFALVEFAKKLTREPDITSDEDIRILRHHGFNDRAILDTILIIGYFNFVNRLVLGTGIPVEGEDDRNYKH
ncbi:MAG: peroxidase-related enzyme [Candidatus Kariarchaeaceae archaeon]|jgi:uncharacterized peroxidase-related enzyme